MNRLLFRQIVRYIWWTDLSYKSVFFFFGLPVLRLRHLNLPFHLFSYCSQGAKSVLLVRKLLKIRKKEHEDCFSIVVTTVFSLCL